MKTKKLISLFSIICFLISLTVFSTSCGGSKKTTAGPKVKSGSGMGNANHKNKHVWGK